MKKILTFLTLLVSGAAQAQYCMLNDQTPYSPLQPGITNFQLNTINRTSGNSESSSAVLVVTGLSTTLLPGQTYTVSISHSEDNQFFQGARNNIRVWIDYNGNFSFNDPGETVISADYEPPGTTFTGSFTVPSSAMPGTLTLRATAKMSSDAGHSLPTSCNVPADPLGYHGEMEDYLVIIGGGSQGVAPVADFAASDVTVCTTGSLVLTNASTGTPSPTFNWSANPATGVVFLPGPTDPHPMVTFSGSGTYSIVCVASNSLGSSSAGKSVTVSICSSVKIDEMGLGHALRIWPNPATGALFVDPGEAGGHFVIRDMSGRVVYEAAFPEGRRGACMVDLEGLSTGYYFTELITGNRTLHSPLIIAAH